MIGAIKMAAALMLGLALTGTMGAAMVTQPSEPLAAPAQEVVNTEDPGIATPISITGDEMFTADDPGELFETDIGGEFPSPDGSGPVAIGLAARWGFLSDPTVAELGGHWKLINETAGGFRGGWKAIGSRAYGMLWGGFHVARDGNHGEFMGKWNYSYGRDGGFLAGSWESFDGKAAGAFWGRWNFTGGKPGGALRGLWHATDRGAGEFGGLAIHAPTMDMVPWDGFVNVDAGGVKLLREVRFEHGGDYRLGGDDKVYPQRERDMLGWSSSTTTNWDGLIVGMLAPGPDTKIVFRTEQWSKEFTARELVGLHIRLPVDRMGHEIELKGFLIPRHRDCGCDGNAVKVTMLTRWGYLGNRTQEEETMTVTADSWGFTPWNGFIEVTKGAVGLKTVLNWEKGGNYREGNDDFVYPRNNKLTIEWRSSTTYDWDGIVVQMCLPIERGMPLPHVTIHTDQWSQVYSLDELRGLDETYKVDDLGHEIQVVAWAG